MKNKKAAIEISIGTIVIIVIAVSMLILSLVLVRSIFNPESQFSIYKEECYIDVTLNDLARYNRDLARLNSYRLDLLEEKDKIRKKFLEIKIKDSKIKLSYKKLYETEICEEVEIDEIETVIKDTFNFNRSYDTISYEEFENYCWSKEGNNKFIYTCEENPKDLLCCYKTIKKQDLSTEWLDKNAECVEYWNIEPCPEGYEDAFPDDKTKTVCNAPYKDTACYQWKIGDYIVRKND